VAKKLESGTVQSKAEYYSPKAVKTEIKDADRERVLKADGVHINNLHDFNKLVVNVEEIRKQMGGDNSWSYAVVNTASNCATLIAQLPGEGNRRHYHNNWDEWWYIIDGEWEYEYNTEKYKIKKGDIVLIQRNNIHKITAIGNKQAIRLAVSREDVDHIYTQEDYVPNK
jgi:quercetin dioxygenase-like cupin family protein